MNNYRRMVNLKEMLDLRALLLHRHQWVRLRTRIRNALQAIALANGVQRGPSLWSRDGQTKIASLPLSPDTASSPLARRLLRKMAKQLKEPIAVEQARPKNRHVFPADMEGATLQARITRWGRVCRRAGPARRRSFNGR